MRELMRCGLVCLLLVGCEQVEDAGNAVNAAKTLVQAAKQAEDMGKAADQAIKEAEEKVLAEAPEGATAEEKEQLVGPAKALAALQAMGKASGGQPVVNWRQLEPFLAESLGDYKAAGDLDGSTKKAGGFEVTTVRRTYKRGDQKVNVVISDTAMSPMLRAPFALAAIVGEDTSRGYRKGSKIEGHAALLEWQKPSKRSQATLLVGERYIVNVDIRGTETHDEAPSVAKLLDLSALAKVKAEADKAE